MQQSDDGNAKHMAVVGHREDRQVTLPKASASVRHGDGGVAAVSFVLGWVLAQS